MLPFQDLLINRKWRTSIYEGICALYKTVSQRNIERIVEITERYEYTLSEINEKVERLEKKVEQRLAGMGFKLIMNYEITSDISQLKIKD